MFGQRRRCIEHNFGSLDEESDTIETDALMHRRQVERSPQEIFPTFFSAPILAYVIFNAFQGIATIEMPTLPSTRFGPEF